jgi:hypothetical protein
VSDPEYVESREEALADYRENGADSTKVWKPSGDPNADLIGFTFSYEENDAVWRCTGSVPWSDQYVTGTLLLVGGKKMENVVKPVAVVRRRKELDDAS